MPWRSRAIASTRSSRSVVSVVCWVSISPSSSSARRLTAPSRSRSRRSRSSSVSTLCDLGQRHLRHDAGQAGDRVGLAFEHLVDLVGDVGQPALGAFDALLGAGGLLAGGAQRFERGAHGTVANAERALGLGQPVGGLAARRFGGFALRRSAPGAFPRRSPARRRAKRAPPWLRRCGCRALRSGRRRGRARSLQACRSVPIAVRRRSASSASRASACASARTSASSARLPSISVRIVGKLALQVGGRRPARRARLRRRSARRALRRGRWRAGSWLRSAPRCARCCAPSRARPWRAARGRCRPRAARCANASRAAASAAPAAVKSDCAASAALRFSSTATRAATNSPSMSARRLRCARRRAAPVGAWASAAKPSQRQRSPSRETRRWPGLSRLASRAPSARSTTPIWARRRASSGRRLNVLRERLRAIRQRRIGRIDRCAHPAHGVGLDRPAHRDRRPAPRRARSRSPSRR